MASRNRVEMSAALFERLFAAASQRGSEIANAKEKRYLRRLNDEDAELMAAGDAQTLFISRQVRLVRITFKSKLLFCVFGLVVPEQLPIGLEPIDLTPAIFSIGVLQARIQPKSSVSVSDIRDAVEADFIGSPEYQGHELDAIAQLFPPPTVYRAVRQEPYLQSDHRVLGSLFARSYADGPIQISNPTMEKLWLTFEAGSKFIPYHNLLQGLMAISWGQLFLETYRCLEQLFAEPRVAALRGQWQSKLSLRELAAMIERHLAWRPKEDDALSKIIGCCDIACVSVLCNAFGLNEPLEGVTLGAEKASRKVYDLRNNVVHYRPIHETIQKTDAEWDFIVSALIDVVNQVYESRGGPFFEEEEQLPVQFATA